MHKVNRVQIYLLLFLALFLQAGALNYVKLFGAKPDLMLILVVFFGLFFGEGTGLEAGLFAGLLKDIFTVDFFGMNMFLGGLTGFIAGSTSEKFFKESKATELFLVFFFTAFYSILHFGLFSMFTSSAALSFTEYLFGSVLPVSAYTGLVSIPVFSYLIKMCGLREQRDFL